MNQKIKFRCNFTLLEPCQLVNRAIILFLLVVSLFLLPSVTHAECSLSGIVWDCSSQGECSDKLSGLTGEGIWSLNMLGQDCKCYWQSHWSYPSYVQCSCCVYQIPGPPPCSNGTPCCDDPSCGTGAGGSSSGPSPGPGPGGSCGGSG